MDDVSPHQYLTSFIAAGLIFSSSTVSVYVLVFGVLVFVILVLITREYVTLARGVKRINSISQSPIFDKFDSVLSGLSIIRAFGRTQSYMDDMHGLIDNSGKTAWAQELYKQWMSFRMGIIGAFFVAAVATAGAVSGADAPSVGYSLTFALRCSKSLTKLLKAMAAVELACNACERVLEYAEMETEPQDGLENLVNQEGQAWPWMGVIKFEEVTAGYPGKLPVFRNLNFEVNAGKRVGIVGPSGAGKSTLAKVLFRLMSPSKGSVYIDDVDISKLKLTYLRRRLGIIPQEPILFL